MLRSVILALAFATAVADSGAAGQHQCQQDKAVGLWFQRAQDTALPTSCSPDARGRGLKHQIRAIILPFPTFAPARGRGLKHQ